MSAAAHAPTSDHNAHDLQTTPTPAPRAVRAAATTSHTHPATSS